MMEERGSPGMTTNKNKAGSNSGLFFVIASEAIHLSSLAEAWIASSLRSSQ
jgi:hypothetical protein